MDAYIRGAVNLVDDRVAYAKANGLSPRTGATYRVPTAPWRKVWHTMEAPEDDPRTVPDEGWELDQTRAYIIRHRTPPHLWALPKHDVVFQTVPLTLAAYALRHDDPAGVRETNHAHAIQTEVIGFARDGLDDPGLCDWLGRRVLAPILEAGIPINPFIVAPSTGSDGYGEGGRVRMTWSQWANFSGQCGHANVPGNSHWDPGLADYTRIARAAAQEDDMPSAEEVAKAVWDHWIEAPGEGVGRARSALRDARQISRRAELATLAQLAALRSDLAGVADIDEAEIAGLVLAGLDPAVIAAAIPDGIAARVVDELHRRTAPG